MGLEISYGAGFYRDMQGKSYYVPREIGERKIEAKLWIEISKEEATASPANMRGETEGIIQGKPKHRRGELDG